MINEFEKKSNNNYLKDYIEYYFNKEINKFSKLKYNLFTLDNLKKSQNITSYNSIDSNHNKYFPKINKNSINDNTKNIKENKYLNSIKNSQKKEGRNNFNNINFPKKRLFDGVSKQNQNINDINKIQNTNDENYSLLNSHRNYQTINLNNFKEINSFRIKRSNSKNIIDSKTSSKNILKNLKNILDKELIINDRTGNKKKTNLNINKESEEIKKHLKKIRSEIKAKKDKEEEKIIDTLYIGNNIINNCKIKDKIIYDIRPLNKTKERASCYFPSKDNSKPIIFQLKHKQSMKKKINKNNNTNCITQKNLKYFRNSYSQIYSNPTNYHSNNDNDIKIDINDDINNNTNYNKENKKKALKYELSDQELINRLNINNENHMNIEINNGFDKCFNKKKNFSETKSFNNVKKDHFKKNYLDYIDLSILVKEIPDIKRNKNNFHSFYAKDENVVRGEKIKFLKTCYQVKFVKPILSQKAYEFKTTNTTKKIFSPKRKKFPINHFNLDILRKLNIKEINNTKSYLNNLKKNMNNYLINLVNHLDKDIKYISK